MKTQVGRYATLLIVESSDNQRFLFSQYDDTFPIEIYRNNINFIGGGNDSEDISPRMNMEREINEELSKKLDEKDDLLMVQQFGANYTKSNIQNFASENDINLVKENILNNLTPYQDFFIKIPTEPEGPSKEPCTRIFGMFYSKVSKEIFDIIDFNLKEGKSLVSEGLLKIVNKEDLISGKIPASWATAPIMQYFLKKEIPNHRGVTILPLGKPRNSFKDYKEFNFGFPTKTD